MIQIGGRRRRRRTKRRSKEDEGGEQDGLSEQVAQRREPDQECHHGRLDGDRTGKTGQKQGGVEKIGRQEGVTGG